MTIGIWVHYPKKNKFSCLLTIYCLFRTLNHQKYIIPPVCHENDFWKTKQKTNLKKIADIRFFVCDCVTYMFPLYKYSLTWKFTEYCISKPSQKKFFWCAYIFFATIYSYLLYFLCMVRNKDFFAILFGYSTTTT